MHITRTIAEKVEAELATEKILILTGPRQAGKTTLLEKLSSDLKAKGEQVYYYNFDRVADLDFFNKQQKVEAFLKIRSLKSRIYIFIDEVQRKKDAGNFFKYFYDEKVNAKFVFSGSSSIELTEQFGDALTGRKRVFKLFPLSVTEVAISNDPQEFEFAQAGDPLAQEQLQDLIDTHLVWGGYPEVVAQADDSQKLQALGELYESYVQKDVKDLLRVKNVSGFNQLVKLLAYNLGDVLVVEDLVRQTGLHANTVNSYLDILEGTMVIARTENYNPDFNSNLPKSQRVFFVDNGMRNYAISQLQSDFRPDADKLARNLIYTELAKKFEYAQSKAQIFHYQTYSDNHIDFIIDRKTTGPQNILPIVSHFPEDNPKLGKKIHEFLKSHTPAELVIITKSLEYLEEVKGCQVKFVPLAGFISQADDLFKTNQRQPLALKGFP